MAVWPHGVELFRSGTWHYIADPDERLCYLPLISHSYEVHPWKLGDLSLPVGGICLYPWLQFVPWILLAKLLHAGPLAVLLLHLLKRRLPSTSSSRRRALPQST